MLVTRVPDLDRWEQDRDHPLIANGMLAHENPNWLETAERQQPNLLYFNSERAQDSHTLDRRAV